MGGDPTDLHPGALRWLTGCCGRREWPEVASVPPRRGPGHGFPAACCLTAPPPRGWWWPGCGEGLRAALAPQLPQALRRERSGRLASLCGSGGALGLPVQLEMPGGLIREVCPGRPRAVFSA